MRRTLRTTARLPLPARQRIIRTVVLLDISLPDMDGYEVARQIRARHGQAIRLIALSGWSEEEDRRRAREAGFDHYLTKPAQPEALERLLGEEVV